MSDAEEYAGCLQASQARAYNRKEYSHSETVHGKEVKYYHCWTKRTDGVAPPFKENEEPNRAKIRGLDAFWRRFFGD